MEALDVVHDPSSSEPSASLTTEHPGGKKPVRAVAPTQHSNQVILGFASPHHVQRTFDMRRAGPPPGEINAITVRTLSSPAGKVELETDREMRSRVNLYKDGDHVDDEDEEGVRLEELLEKVEIEDEVEEAAEDSVLEGVVVRGSGKS